jgi:uncharacterized membrane protein
MAGWGLYFLLQKANDDTKLGDAGGLFDQVSDRGAAWITALFLGVMLTVATVAIWGELTRGERGTRRPALFALLLTATALLLILGTEFFYVGDVFNNRMNTVFKLYYQAWLLLAVAAGFALYVLVADWRPDIARADIYRFAWAGATAIVLAGAALYPLGGTYNRTDGDPWRRGDFLHGLAHFSAAERAGIEWLNERADGQRVVIAEAVGNDYTLASRISAATGIPTIVGWVGHQSQWRGSPEPYAGRFEDVEALYRTASLEEAQQIIDKYGVTYIYVGQLERQQYETSGGLAKFESLPVRFQSNEPRGENAPPEVTIYGAVGLRGEAETAQ